MQTITISNGAASATFTDYGATLTHFVVAGRDIVLGFDSPQEYADLGKQPYNPYFGCAVGRTANRIANGSFALNGKDYTLVKTHGDNNLHGGPKGFDKVIFKTTATTSDSVTFEYTSPDGEEGFPGTLHVLIKYTLHANPTALEIAYSAHLIDAPAGLRTPVNLTNHSYFNLAGTNSNITAHTLEFPHRSVLGLLEMTDSQCPTGKILPVPKEFDFYAEKKLGDDLESETVQRFKGYDHYYMLSPTVVSASRGANAAKMPVVARVKAAGLVLEVLTTCSGFQLYTGQHVPSVPAKAAHGGVYGKYAGVAIETSYPPDAVNRKDVGWDVGVVIGADDVWEQTTVYVVREE